MLDTMFPARLIRALGGSAFNLNMERNRINHGKYYILLYGEKFFEPIRSLIRPNLEEALNLPHHGLDRGELLVVLYELFTSYMLVAMHKDRGLFTPTLEEIETALAEVKPFACEAITHYGMTSGAYDLFAELRAIYG